MDFAEIDMKICKKKKQIENKVDCVTVKIKLENDKVVEVERNEKNLV